MPEKERSSVEALGLREAGPRAAAAFESLARGRAEVVVLLALLMEPAWGRAFSVAPP